MLSVDAGSAVIFEKERRGWLFFSVVIASTKDS